MAVQSKQQRKILVLAAAALDQQLAEALTFVAWPTITAPDLPDVMQRLWGDAVELLLIVDGPQHADVTALCGRVRQYFQTPILVLAAGASEAERIAWLDGGADDVLAWPGGLPSELPARCRALLRRAARQLRRDPSAHRLRALGVELDLAGRCLYLPGGCTLTLTDPLTRFLAVCFCHSDALVSFDTLGAEIFGARRANVRRRVYGLAQGFERRMATVSGPRPRLELVRGLGYRLRLVDPGGAAVPRGHSSQDDRERRTP